MKIKIGLIYRCGFMSVLILLLVTVFVLTLFFYQNIYTTITSSGVILELQRETAIVEPPNVAGWNKIKEYFKKVGSLKLPAIDALKDPFD